MLIRVMYGDYRYDYVNTDALNRLITSARIVKFLRLSEDRWVEIACGPIRGIGGTYTGEERRRSKAS
jgi:hypothetical protein